MAFEKTVQTVLEARRGLVATEESVKSARSARDKLTDDIYNAKRKLERKKNSQYFPTNAAKRIIKEMKDRSIVVQILNMEIDKAVAVNIEFARDEYKQALYQVAADKDIYKMIPEGSGWAINIRPLISFEEEAGQLNDWAKGISGFREELGTKVGDKESDLGAKATDWWSSNVYQTKLQTKTFLGRMAHSSGKAPFWEIVNNGSQPLASDRPDASYNPIPAKPTDFIGDAQRAIRAEFKELFNPLREEWEKETKALEAEIETATEIRDGFSDDIRQLTPDVKLNARILQSLGKRAQYADQNKLAKAIQKYRAGEEFENPTINLTRAGSKRKVTLSARKLEGLIGD